MAEFSSLLWSINRLAQEQPLSSFHHAAFKCLQETLPFEKAWWGRAAHIDGHVKEHSCHLFNLEPEFIEDWLFIQHEDITIDRVHREPGQAVIINMRKFTPGLCWLGERHGLGELICVIHTNPHTQLSDHLSLYRAPGAQTFSEHDRHLLTHLMTHLSAAVDASQVRTLMARREHLTQQHLVLAVCDHQSVLHGVERGFADLMLLEWPGWKGPRLPVELNESGYQGEQIRIQCLAVDDLWLLTVYRRGPLACLSGRECEVARQFGEGLTYKEIARTLEIAPSTVRHHLRSIYGKLGVHDKASIANLVNRTPFG